MAENKILLAEKVETTEQYEQAKEMGFHLFQGFFFSKPSIISKSVNKQSTKLQYIRIVRELKNPEQSYQQIAKIIENDVILSYRLLRIIKHRSEDDVVCSIKRALVYMCFDEIERFKRTNYIMDIYTPLQQVIKSFYLCKKLYLF